MPRRCPRCTGAVLRDVLGDASCVLCGWEYIPPRELERGKRWEAWNATRSPRAHNARVNLHLGKW